MSPSLILSAILAAAIALVYHLWRGGAFFRLIVGIATAWIGFAIGHFLGSLFGLQWIMIGDIHLVEGLIGALILLVIVDRAD